jgi:hypothetical protein
VSVPSPDLSATDVVCAQLEGLRTTARDGREVDDGLQLVWSFASPGNRAATGPVESFAQLLRSTLYRGLLGHRAAQLGPLTEFGDEAQQEVLVLTADDRTLGFTWVLGRTPAPPHPGCWLTEGVLRHPDEGEP